MSITGSNSTTLHKPFLDSAKLASNSFNSRILRSEKRLANSQICSSWQGDGRTREGTEPDYVKRLGSQEWTAMFPRKLKSGVILSFPTNYHLFTVINAGVHQ